MHRSGLIELEVVMAVMRLGTFRAAAQALSMSPTAVSNAIAGLESRLNVRLFHRTTRSVALTEAGERFVARVGPALREIQQAADEIHSLPSEPSGTLRINIPQSAGQLFLDQIVVRFLARYPLMRLEITSEARMIDIVAEGYDAGIRLGESVPQDMIAVPLMPDIRMQIVATPEWFATHGTPQTPDDLYQHQGICMRMANGGIYRWELSRHGQHYALAIPPRLATSDFFTSLTAVRAGLGVGFLPGFYIEEDLRAGRLVSVLDDWTQPFQGLCLYYPGHRHIPEGLRAFIDFVRAG